MWMRKFNTEADENVSAILEPATGHSLDEILTILRSCGAEVTRTSGNSLTFDGAFSDLELVEPIARIHLSPNQRISEKHL